MKMSKAGPVALALGLMILISFTGQCHGALQFGFYNGKCKGENVEDIVKGIIADSIMKDPTLVAALLRMQFHDCFVNGCDASILLDGSDSEKTARPNLSVRGYEIINAAKAAVEAKCPDLVSCADIIVMATRDAVSFSGGRRYDVQTGRKDGLVSLAKNVDLPSPSISVNDSIAAFDKKGLSVSDMVYLLGGHTVGIAHCSLIQDRLYNFSNSGLPDPSMDHALLEELRAKCPQNAATDNTVNLDQNPRTTTNVVDNLYYQQIFFRRGVLRVDQELAFHSQTKGLVVNAAFGFNFPYGFGQAMVKLGTLQDRPGSQGETRKKCNVVNNPTNILSTLIEN